LRSRYSQTPLAGKKAHFCGALVFGIPIASALLPPPSVTATFRRYSAPLFSFVPPGALVLL
jgi:hypothetical protein